MRNIQRLWVGAMVCSLVLFVGGCVHVVKLSDAHVTPVANPEKGPAVKVVKVTDMRVFEVQPKDIQTPTVEHDQDINDPSVTLRAIGKARNNGHTFYFIYHKKRSETVATAVQGAVENALRDRGYVVVADDSPAAAGAIPVEVAIRKFWAWWEPGFWTIEAKYEVEVDVKSSITLNGGTESAVGSHFVHSAYMPPAVTRNCVRDGLRELTINLQSKLKSP